MNLVPQSSPNSVAFDFDGGWGLTEGWKRISVAPSPTSTTLELLSAPGYYVLGPMARGSLVLWSEWSPPYAKLQGWTRAGGLKTLVSHDWDVRSIAISDSRIVWLGTRGPESAPDVAWDTARLFWSPLATSATEIRIHEGPSFERNIDSVVHTAGDWAAVGYCPSRASCGATLINLADMRVFHIASPPGEGLWWLMVGLSPRELLFGEKAAVGGSGYSALRRVELASLTASAP
jgi:hypothetical protein